MPTLIPWYGRWAALAALAAALWGHGYATGLERESDRRDAQDADQRQKAVTLGNRLSGSLARKNAVTNANTQEVLKNVPNVTTGRKCLGASAVRLLNDPAPHLSTPAWKPAAPPPSAEASDRDVAGWIATTRGQYKLVADQLNGLIDYVEGKEPDNEESIE